MEELYLAIALDRKGSGLISTPVQNLAVQGVYRRVPAPRII